MSGLGTLKWSNFAVNHMSGSASGPSYYYYYSNTYLYALPRNANDILEVHIDYDDVVGYPTSSVVSNSVSYKWSCTVLGPGDKIYGCPHNAGGVLIFDLVKFRAGYTALTLLDISQHVSGTMISEGGVLRGGSLYFLPKNADAMVAESVTALAVTF